MGSRLGPNQELMVALVVARRLPACLPVHYDEEQAAYDP